MAVSLLVVMLVLWVDDVARRFSSVMITSWQHLPSVLLQNLQSFGLNLAIDISYRNKICKNPGLSAEFFKISLNASAMTGEHIKSSLSDSLMPSTAVETAKKLNATFAFEF